MSATRVARRAQWRRENPSIFNAHGSRVRAQSHLSFHVWSIAKGYRPKLFQLALRARCERATGCPTSTAIHAYGPEARAHG